MKRIDGDGSRPQYKPPFPWFGGKSRVAHVVWEHFGNVPNYVEPFFGSGAVLFLRPHEPRIETVNDVDGLLCNFWRALAADPDAVAHYADWPVNENDLHARHAYLVNLRSDFVPRLEGDPDFYDARLAGWWVWGVSQWIGSGWCSGKGPWQSVDGRLVKGSGDGIKRQRPHLGNTGTGVHRKRPHLGDAGTGEHFQALAARLRRVRVCCGDFRRVLGPTPTVKLGVTGVFLDPPYAVGAGRTDDLYAVETEVSAAAREWALEHGDDPRYRIALCGYEGEHVMPDSWACVPWKASGGYGSQGQGRGAENAARERIWFSPHCLVPATDVSAAAQKRLAV